MDKKEILSVIEEVAHHEWWEITNDRFEPEWDIPATALAIYDELINDTEYVEWLSKRMDWEQSESIALRTLDYFSSYEPVFKEIANV